MENNNLKNEQQCAIHNVIGSTHLLVIRDWVTPYNSNMKGNHALANIVTGKQIGRAHV